MKSILERHPLTYTMAQVPSCQLSLWEHKQEARSWRAPTEFLFQHELVSVMRESLRCEN